MQNAIINGIECKLYYDERISPKNAPKGYPYIYYIRHDEDNWTLPIQIEKYVLVNFFGTVFMKHQIDFDQSGYLDIADFEMDGNFLIIGATKPFLRRTFGL